MLRPALQLGLLASVLVTLPAYAEKRVALVVGNSAYEHTRALPNPKNDAEVIAKVLRQIGFDARLRVNLGYRELRQEIREFGLRAQGADIALIHFAGHGLEIAGENYLIPVDAKLGRDVDLEYEAVTLASILKATIEVSRLRIVILDACRNNPLGDKMVLSSGVARSVNRGLARIEPQGDVLVAFSAKAGTLANDGDGPMSPYAEALIKHLPSPGLDVRLLFGRVRDDVLAMTKSQQEPYIYGSLKGEVISFVPSLATDVEATQRELARFAAESVAKAKAREADAIRRAEEAARKRQEAEAEAERAKAEARRQRTAALEAEKRHQEAVDEAEQKKLHAASRWAAVATNKNDYFFWNFNHDDQDSATNSLLEHCRKQRVSGCRLITSFQGSCFALYRTQNPSGGWAWKVGANVAQARDAAASACRGLRANVFCFLDVTFCADGSERYK